MPDTKDAPLTVGDTGTETSPGVVLPSDLVITDANVHHFGADWTFATTEIAVGEHLIFGWEGIVSDAYGQPREAGAFDTAWLLRAGSDPDDLSYRLGIDDLTPVILERFEASVSGLLDLHTSAFVGFEPDEAFVESASESWLFALGQTDTDRFDLLTGIILQPTASQAGTLVTLGEGIASVDASGRIDGDEIRTAGGRSDYTVDWSQLTTDGYGKPYLPSLPVELFVGRYDDVYEPDDLGGQILALADSASGWWTVDTAGQTALALETLTDTQGPFPGFVSGEVYLIGARCPSCLGAAPLWVVGLSVR